MLKQTLKAFSVIILALIFVSSVSYAATVSGSGRQSRGYPGHNAEISGQLFTLPANGTISNIDSQGASGFWIEKESGEMVRNFDTIGESAGYSLPAGRYRVIPNIKDGFNTCWVNVTFTYP